MNDPDNCDTWDDEAIYEALNVLEAIRDEQAQEYLREQYGNESIEFSIDLDGTPVR